jgi:transcriptional regulator with XRE-family HTH domain
MESIGQKISDLRKSKNMTQMELADKMGISFQAVSNWERGNSMPDIAKLPELAQLFEVTIDELLGEKSKLLDSVVSENTINFLQNNTVTADEFREVAPILKPVQTDTIFENVKPPFDLSEVSDLLPFISRDILNQLALKSLENGNYKDLGEIAPFVDRSIINQIAHKMISEDKGIGDIAPFISKEIIGNLAVDCYEKKGLSSLDDIAPFIPKEILLKIAETEYANRGLKHFESIAPFMDKVYLNELAKKSIQKDGIKAISPIAPFLHKNMLSEYVKEKYL